MPIFVRPAHVILALLLLALLGPSPSRAQDPLLIESDDPRVFQNGTWSSQPTPAASNGSYLYNPSPVGAGLRPAQSEPPPPVLGLSFVGSAIEIIYVSGPQFGTLAIEIDGTVLRTVITTAEKITYGQLAQVNYLSDEPHSLKVYAQSGGIIAVDAFRISPISPSPVLERGPGGEVAFLDNGGIQSSSCSPPNAIHRVSLTSTGAQATGESVAPSISNDGRYVAFSTDARLVPGDGDGFQDAYVYDRLLCTIQIVSINAQREKGNNHSGGARISANGRYVAFTSDASNLVAGDTNANDDVFVHDRFSGNMFRVSVATGGTQATGAFMGGANISADGRFVTFFSFSTNLVAGDTNGQGDIFVHDRQTNITTRVSVATGGAQGVGGTASAPDISADGRYVAFSSDATNLVAGDTNAAIDVFVHDRQANTTTRVSVITGGGQATGGSQYSSLSISPDGRFVVFDSELSTLVAGDTNAQPDIYVHDRQTTTTTRVSVSTAGVLGDSFSTVPDITADGRYVAFTSIASNLVSGDTNGLTDLFLHDRQTGTTTRLSVGTGGTQAIGGNGASYPSFSGDGQYIAFSSGFTNLVASDTNGVMDVFVMPRLQPATDKLALFQPVFTQVNLLNTLADNPPHTAYTASSVYAPITGGQWVMGDWNGDGQKTPGVYANGPFYYTNKSGESQPSDWFSLWIGVPGVPVSGRFNGALLNDCIGAVQQSSMGGSTVFVLYFTCNLTGTTTPAITSQWLSAVLPDSGGFSGVHQFGAGDFNGDGVDSIAVRRGTFIAFGNVAPTSGPAAFDLAQFIGAPLPDASIFVVGNWDNDAFDSFGLFYQNGEFFFRNDLLFNSGAFANQSIGQPFAGTVQATTWR